MNNLSNECKYFLHTSLLIVLLSTVMIISSVDGGRNYKQNQGRNITHYSRKKISNGNNYSISKRNQNRGHNVAHQPHTYFSHSQDEHKLSNQNQRRNNTHYSRNKISNGHNHSISSPNRNKGYNATRFSNNNRKEIHNRNRGHNITQQRHKNVSHPKNQQKLTNLNQARNFTHVSRSKLTNKNNHSISYPNRNRVHNKTHNPHSNSSNWNNHPKPNLNRNKTHSTMHFPHNNSSNRTNHSKLYPDRIRDRNIIHRPSNNFPIGWNADTNIPPSNKLPIGWNIDTNTPPSNKLPIGWNSDNHPNIKLPTRWNDNYNTHSTTNSSIKWDININIHPNGNLPMRPVDTDAHLNNHVVLYPSSDDSTVNVHSHYDKHRDQKIKLHDRLRPHYHNRSRSPHQEYSSFSNKTLLYNSNSAAEGKLIVEDDLPIPGTICGKTLCSYVLNYPTTEIEDAVGRAREVLEAMILNAHPPDQDISQIINPKNSNSSSLTYNTMPFVHFVNETSLCRTYINEISPLQGFSSEDGITYHIVNVPSFVQNLISIECDSSNDLTCGQTIGATVLENRACQQLYREEKLVVLPISKHYYKNDDFQFRTIYVPTECNCILSRKGY